MPITPNTNFSVGAVLTAAQQNRFPRGVVAYSQVTTTDSTITSEEVQITGSSFTAVADRYYRITYFEPGFGASTSAAMTMRVRQTSIAGTVLQSAVIFNTGTQQQTGTLSSVSTFAAGSVNVVATLQNSTGTGSANRSATAVAFLLVEDIGPA